MKILVLVMISIGLTACASTKPAVSEWPSPFPIYVSNRSTISIWVVWTFGAKEERNEVSAGEDTELLPPFVTDSDQPIKKIIAIENAVSRFDVARLDQSKIPNLRFVVKDAATIEVYERNAMNTPIAVLKGKPN